jgi:hypothetical protein
MAERHWRELRPSHAGRFRLDTSLRPDREHARDARPALGRPRRQARPKLRTTSR